VAGEGPVRNVLIVSLFAYTAARINSAQRRTIKMDFQDTVSLKIFIQKVA
jgi:hypothetical protein